MMDNYNKSMFPNMQKSTKDLVKETWNDAIEAAAKMIEDKFDFLGEELIAATEIRKLKR